MADQVTLKADARPRPGKGETGRLRRSGRVPAIMYGHEVEPTPVHVDNLELYHVLHTEAGLNVLIQLEIDGDGHLCVARDIQRHPVRGDVLHVDFLAVDPEQRILVEVPVSLTGEEDVEAPGVLSHVLWTVPILVRPTEVPNRFELSVAGMAIGDVKRVEDIREQLPEGAEFDIDPERTIATVNPPDVVAEEPTEEEGELEAEGAPAGEEAADTEAATEDAGDE